MRLDSGVPAERNDRHGGHQGGEVAWTSYPREAEKDKEEKTKRKAVTERYRHGLPGPICSQIGPAQD